MKKKFLTFMLLAAVCGFGSTVVSSCAPPHHMQAPPAPPHP